VTVAACAVLFIAAGCSKGQSNGSGSTGSPSPTATAAAAAAGVPTYDVTVQNFTYHGMPSSVPANRPVVVSFTNKESFEIDHEFVVLRLTGRQDRPGRDQRREEEGRQGRGRLDPLRRQRRPAAHQLQPRGHHEPAPGNYVATCWQTGKAGGGTGPPHVTIGMIAPFTASTTATVAAAT
jgi:hypothetical protein